MNEREDLGSGVDESLGGPAPHTEQPISPTPSGDTPAPAPAPVTPPVTQVQREVPFAALLDERDKRKAAEAEAKELKAWRADQERKARETELTAPDMFADPKGFNAFIEKRIVEATQAVRSEAQQTIIDDRLEASEEKWTEKLEGEQWRDLNEWIAQRPPEWHQDLMTKRDPYGQAWRQFEGIKKAEQARAVSERLGGKDLDAFLNEQKQAWLAEHGQAPQADADDPEPAPAPVRAPDGRFAPSQPPKRSAPSLAAVNGAPTPRQSEAADGDALFKQIYK